MSAHTDSSVFIDADIDTVWDLTNRVEDWASLFPEYSSAEVLERTQDTVRFRLTMHPDENGNAWSWVSERRLYPAERRVVARRLELGWYRHMDIEWTYQREGTGTRMRWVQDFAMRDDSPFDDAAMAARITTNSKIQMDAIRQKVERAAALKETS
jgi:aromatase